MQGLYVVSYTLVVLAVVLAGAHSKSLGAEKTVQVQLYYESLCPGCRGFITDQLYPTYTLLGKEKIALELIPYGFAEETIVNGTKTFTCQHGPNECYANKAYACAINLTSVEKSIDFMYCTEGSNNPAKDANLEKCAESAKISWTDIQECLTSGKASELLSAYGEMTKLLNPYFVPYLVIDGTSSDEQTGAALADFKGFICNLLGNPTECK